MDALEFIKERNRMCKSFGDSCSNCPASKNSCCYTYEWQEELVAVVEKWSTEHPRKTHQSEFLKQFPYARCFDGVVVICPKVVDTYFSCPVDAGENISCPDCRHEFWSQEIE
nr:MAG TPA: RimK-related lysine biosynthesis protein, Probable-dependent amine/thiol ligase family Amino-group [Caudoviricetes sp.]